MCRQKTIIQAVQVAGSATGVSQMGNGYRSARRGNGKLNVPRNCRRASRIADTSQVQLSINCPVNTNKITFRGRGIIIVYTLGCIGSSQRSIADELPKSRDHDWACSQNGAFPDDEGGRVVERSVWVEYIDSDVERVYIDAQGRIIGKFT